MKNGHSLYQQSSRTHGNSHRLNDYLFSRESAFSLLITLAQLAMYWRALEAFR